MASIVKAMANLGSSQPGVIVDLSIHYVCEPKSYVAVRGFGQAGAIPLAGTVDKSDTDLIRLDHAGDGLWVARIRVPLPSPAAIRAALEGSKENLVKAASISEAVPNPHLVTYKYVVVWPHKRRYEALQTRRFLTMQGLANGNRVTCRDSFRAPNSNVFVTSAFTDAIFGPHSLTREDSTLGDKTLGNNWTIRKTPTTASVAVRFVLLVPRLRYGHTIHIMGEAAPLGEWNPERKIHMVNMGQHLYATVVHFDRSSHFPVKYKYAIFDERDNLVFRERHEPRSITAPSSIESSFLNVDEFFRYEAAWKGAGVAIPVSSLRSDTSMGVGEFSDLEKLVDWSAHVGLQLIQLLPVNDTGMDPSPYSANSVFALHPIYLNIPRAAEKAFRAVDSPVPNDITAEINKAIAELNPEPQLKYQHVLSWKLHILGKIAKLTQEKVLATTEFREWWTQSINWLPPYACWKSIVEATGEWDFSNWKETVADVPRLIEKDSALYERVCFCYFVQYMLHDQLTSASQYAKKHGVALKGDLPIGVARYSADTWTYQKIFRMDWSAGAPPNGPPPAQNWDFPLYNWDVMNEDGYAWWRQRLTQMNQYFQAFRIDHVLGFFRIWAIPAHNYSGLQGRLEPCQPVTLEELKKNKLDGDLDRLTRPYIRSTILQEKFGSRAEKISTDFLEEYTKGCFDFKNETNTQAKLDKLLKTDDDMTETEVEETEKLKKGLFELMDDVLVIADTEKKGVFYPTCHMHFTRSFAEFGPPEKKEALSRLQNDFFWVRQSWRKEGSDRLGAIQGAAKMMVCAEDLGAVPPEVFEVLDELGILGLRVQRWPSTGAFGVPEQYGYLTVASPSCHDCSTMRGWWEEDRDRCQDLYRTFFGPDAPGHCEDWVSQKVVEAHLQGSSMWAVMPLQDLMDMWGELRSSDPATDAINKPGMKDGVWVYRMPFTLEHLQTKEHFNQFLLEMIERTNRLSAY